MKNVITNALFPRKKISSFKINSLLKRATKKDLSFKKGEILGSMCTTPPSLAKKIFKKYIDVNLGDPGLFKGSSEIEKLTLKMVGNLLHSNCAVGSFVTGGTEANIIAMECALLNFLKRYTDKGLLAPPRNQLEMIVPESAHFSFQKAATLLGVCLKKIPLNEKYQVLPNKLKESITPNTFAIVAIAGTTGLGVIDDIKTISKIAKEKNIFLHVDAAFGGFVIPFMDEAFTELHPFDFLLDGVSSITVDPHKMGQGVTPGGIILFKEDSLIENVKMDVNYLAGGKTTQLTLVGTRNGGAVLACFSSLLHLGYNGYRKIVKKAIAIGDYFIKQLKTLSSYKIVVEPTINVIGFYSDKMPTQQLATLLKSKRVAVSTFDNYIRVVIMPQIQKKDIDTFIKLLKQIEETYE